MIIFRFGHRTLHQSMLFELITNSVTRVFTGRKRLIVDSRKLEITWDTGLFFFVVFSTVLWQSHALDTKRMRSFLNIKSESISIVLFIRKSSAKCFSNKPFILIINAEERNTRFEFVLYFQQSIACVKHSLYTRSCTRVKFQFHPPFILFLQFLTAQGEMYC